MSLWPPPLLHVLLGVTWEQVLRKLGALKDPSWKFRRRSTGVLETLCPFHCEVTPSIRYWQSGNFRCYGCGQEGNIIDFVFYYFRGTRERELQGEIDREMMDFFSNLPALPDPRQLLLPFGGS